MAEGSIRKGLLGGEPWTVEAKLTPPIRVAHVTTVDLTLRFLLLPQLIRLREEGYDVTTISAPGPWTGDVEAQGIRHIPWLHATRSWNPAADLIAFRELNEILRREKFHLVHTHNPKPSVLGRIAARLAGVPCVVNTVHGFYATPEDRLAKRIPVLAMERLAVRFSDLELYVSEEDILWSRRLGLVGPDSSLLLRNGVDLSAFDPSLFPEDRLARLRRELGIPKNALIVGTVARLVVEKGYRELFAAAAHLRTAFPDVRYLAVGPADTDKADALNQRELDRARGSVIFTGLRQDIPSLLALMDVFVLPSWREGLPQSAIEAAAMGKPLVLTDIRGCREVVRHEVEGLLVPPREPVRLAEAIARLVEDPDLRRKMGAAARARAIERFDERKILDVIVSEYRSLLARKGFPGRAAGRPHLYPRRMNMWTKRAMDVVLSAAALAGLWPFLLTIAVVIRLTMGRPVLFVQERPGLHGRIFRIYKFRTMHDLRGPEGEPLSDGARISRIGRFLRAASLDELPELVNVLKGDMSLVGPRPLRVEYLPLYSPEQARRHEIRPGVTGWAQVNGRNAVSWEKRFDYDVWYVDHWSLALDFKILGLTVLKVFRGEGISARDHATMPFFTGSSGAAEGDPERLEEQR